VLQPQVRRIHEMQTEQGVSTRASWSDYKSNLIVFSCVQDIALTSFVEPTFPLDQFHWLDTDDSLLLWEVAALLLVVV
jgi:hypothetical protein